MQAPCSNFVTAAVETVMNIHRSDAPGDVLVFVTGQDDVESCIELLRQETQGRSFRDKLLLLPLYAGAPCLTVLVLRLDIRMCRPESRIGNRENTTGVYSLLAAMHVVA